MTDIDGNTTAAPKPNKPEKVFHDGLLKATMWRNPGGLNEQGEQRPDWFSTELTRSYKDRDGNWQESHTLSGIDLLRGEKLLGLAYEHEQYLKDVDREAAPERSVDTARSQYQDIRQPKEEAPAHDRAQNREAPRER